MKSCSSCQFYNPAHAERCVRCGAPLQEEPVKKLRVTSKPFYRLGVWLRKIGTTFRRIFSSRLPDYLPHRFVWVAGWLGFFPGLGQLYNHQHKKALFYFLGFACVLTADVLTIREPFSNYLLFATLLLMFWSFNDALSSAARINGQWWTWRHSLAFLSYLFFMLGITFLAIQFFFSPIIKFVYVSQDVLAPGLRKSDRVLIECVSYWFGSPRQGDVVFYDPPRYEIEIPGAASSTTFMINERRSFERVMGLPGDMLERRQGQFFLNDKPLPPHHLPLATSELPHDFRIGPVPEEKYLVLITHHSEESGLIPGFGGIAPRLDSPRIIVKGWEEASLVSKKEIFGRVLLIYQPPQHRRFFHR